MKKILLFMLLASSTLAFADTKNPFENSEWFIESNSLKIKYHTPEGTYDHSISYHLPNGFSGESDYCALTSETTLNCITGDTVTYNADAHSMTLHFKNQSTYTYYESGYLPAGNALSGTWNVKNCNPQSMYTSTLVVPYADASATTISNISEYSTSGFRNGSTYYVSVDKYSKKVYFGPYSNGNSNWGFYLIDADNNFITDINQFNKAVKLREPDKNFEGVYCEFTKN